MAYLMDDPLAERVEGEKNPPEEEVRRHRPEEPQCMVAESRRRADQEAAALKRFEEEERRRHEEKARQRAESEALLKRAAEEAVAWRKLLEERAHRQAEEEGRRKAEEEAALKRVEEARQYAEEQEARRRAEEEEIACRRAAAAEASERAEAQAARLRAEEIKTSPQAAAFVEPDGLAELAAAEFRWSRPVFTRLAVATLALCFGTLVSVQLISRHTLSSSSSSSRLPVAVEHSAQPPATNTTTPGYDHGASDPPTLSEPPSSMTIQTSWSKNVAPTTSTASHSPSAQIKRDEQEKGPRAQIRSPRLAPNKLLKVKHEEDVFRASDKSRPARRELEDLYLKRARVLKNRDFEALMEFFAPDYSATLRNGQTLNHEQIRDYLRRGMKQFVKITGVTFTIESLTVKGKEAIVDVRQNFSRTQKLRDGKVHTVATSVLQRETWRKTVKGWKLRLVDNLRDQRVMVDGKAVALNEPYNMSDPLYIPRSKLLPSGKEVKRSMKAHNTK